MIEEIKNYKGLLDKIKSFTKKQVCKKKEKGSTNLSKMKNSVSSDNNFSFLSNLIKGNFLSPAVIWKVTTFAFWQLRKRPKIIWKVGKFAVYTFLFFRARKIWRFLKK